MPIQPITTGIHHLALRCTNMEITKAFYRDILGLPLIVDIEALMSFLMGSVIVAFRLAQIFISTKRTDYSIEIKIRDNGIGIPNKIKEKVFHLFFTTKPTGLGTGLVLSLSYDIIKLHKGELKPETKDNGFTGFIIELPIQKNQS